MLRCTFCYIWIFYQVLLSITHPAVRILLLCTTYPKKQLIGCWVNIQLVSLLLICCCSTQRLRPPIPSSESCRATDHDGLYASTATWTGLYGGVEKLIIDTVVKQVGRYWRWIALWFWCAPRASQMTSKLLVLSTITTTVESLIIESLRTKKWVSTGAIGVLDDLLVVKTKIWESGWVPLDIT